MRTRPILFAALYLLGTALLAADAEPRHVVMISIDGLKPESSVRADELGLKVPNLRRLMREGVWAEGVVGVLPTVTYPSHTTLITGVLPNVHGIVSNHQFDPMGTGGGAWYWYADEIRVPTLVSAAAARRLRTATVSWPVSIGLGATYQVPEYMRPGSSAPTDLKMLAALSTPGIFDDAAAHRGRAFPPLSEWTDRERVDLARFIIETYRPSLTLLHIFDTDEAEHSHGPGSPEAFAAIERADGYVGEIRESLRKAGIEATTLVAIVSDHGFLPITTTISPNTLLRQAGLIELDAQGRVKSWRASFHADGGTTALYLRDPNDREALERVTRLVREKLADANSGIADVLDAARVRALGGSAPLVLNARPGFYFGNDASGDWARPSSMRGTHGYVPDNPAMYASLILAGPFDRRGSLGVVPMTRIAPAIAEFLGIQLDPQAAAAIPLR
ncbi:MAG TPA: ectonucleotide pyrophosphatase/phosphodiesterase [Thermoanaerobaculia bacterium]|nr:ectonucleotide pyrophosphatase/phosphodiesterase [Thermoanaerobaculia bacterium]